MSVEETGTYNVFAFTADSLVVAVEGISAEMVAALLDTAPDCITQIVVEAAI